MEIKDILLFIVSIITAYLSLFILRGKKDYSDKAFAIFILFVGFWAFGVAFFDLSQNREHLMLLARFYYFAAAAIPTSFLLFSQSFPKELKIKPAHQLISLVPFLLISLCCIFLDGFIIKDVTSLGTIKAVVINQTGYLVYALYFVITICFAYYNLIRSLFKYKDDRQVYSQLKFIIIGTIIPYFFGMFFNLILPLYTYAYVWAGPLFGLAVVFTVLYSVYKHHLFDIKVVAAELFTFTLCLFILIRSLVAVDTTEKITNVVLLLFTIIISIFLIKSVRKEIEAKEKIESLVDDLENANQHLTELDQQKSEFVSLASHQLRGPLTAVKGYASMLLDGDFGELNPEARDGVEKIFESTKALVIVVNDYLDVSRIEQGRMQYDFSVFDLRDLASTVVTELRPNIEKAKLSIDFDYDMSGNYSLNADQGKIKQVIGNLIDNAIKYTPKGSIHVWLTHNSPTKILLTISDTGVGIHPDVLPRLFEKFTRAPDASKTNIMGTGLGLYVARKMIEAHHGRVWADSAGPGKGSTFFIELEAYAG